MDTIFALSSGRPPAAIAIMRVSGPGAREVAMRMAGGLLEPRQASVRRISDAAGVLLDRALVLWFPGPGSATGEDVLELHLHGGRAVVRSVERVLNAMPGLRPAEAGEFTRRALTNGRIDLAQAAGLADLLEAETEAERKAALASSEGQFSRDLSGWMRRLVDAGGMIEAAIDHDDEADVAISPEDVGETLRRVAEEIRTVLRRPSVERLRGGVRVVLAGPPNSGKSSLFNALSETDTAIVSSIAGTTRDRLASSVIRGGITFELIDTAGLNEHAADPIERIGIDRAKAAMQAADLILWLGDDTPDVAGRVLWINSRHDLPDRSFARPEQIASVSVYDRTSIDALWRIVAREGKRVLPPPRGYIVREASRGVLVQAVETLEKVDPRDLLICAEHVREATNGLGSLLGIDVGEAVLDALFARFCIGK